MLTPEYLSELPNSVVKIFQDIEKDVIKDVSERMARDIALSATSEYQLGQLLLMGYDIEDIQKDVIKKSKLAQSEAQDLIRKSAYLAHENDRSLYYNGGNYLGNMSPAMEQVVNAMVKQTRNDFDNITNSLGIIKDGGVKYTTMYQETLNKATVKLASGAYTQNQVIKEAVTKLSKEGVQYIDFKSGRRENVDSVVRRAVLTNSTQLSGIISLNNANDMGQTLMEISSHSGARPSHAEWQGEVVSLDYEKGYLSPDDIGEGTGEGFKGFNCRHDWYPYFEGISQPIEKFVEPEPSEYNGVTYDSYEATQKQRYHERKIKETKREIEALKSAGLSDDLRNAQIKLTRQNKEYRDFSNAVGLRPKTERTGIVNVTGQIKKLPNPASGAGYKKASEAFASLDLSGIDKPFANKIEKSLLNLQNDYPINKNITVRTTDRDGVFGYSRGGNISTGSGFNGRLQHKDELVFNRYYHKTESQALASHSVNAGRIGSKVKSSLSTIEHEYAHAIDNYYMIQKRPDIKELREYFKTPRGFTNENILKNNEYVKATNGTQDYLSTELYDSMRKSQGMKVADFKEKIKEELGTYATTNKKEFLAEGFSYYRIVPLEEQTEFMKEFGERFELLFRSIERGQ